MDVLGGRLADSMIELGLAFVCLALVATLVYVLRAGALERRRLVEQAAAERAELLQRIQAPDVAVAEHVQASRGDRPRPRAIAADDDAAYVRRKRERDEERGLPVEAEPEGDRG